MTNKQQLKQIALSIVEGLTIFGGFAALTVLYFKMVG